MKLRFRASSKGSWPERLSVGVAGVVLAVVLGTGPLAATPAGAASAAAKASTPDPDGIHPIDYSLERLGGFSGGLAAVKSQGKWGYVDKTGKVVIPFLYSEATPFDGHWASVKRNGRYGVIDKTGKEITVHRPLAKLSRFSEGLAAAKAKIEGPWGYVDWTGAFVIKPQFDRADDFSSGFAAVAVKGTWSYVTPTGTVALVTPYYRAYGFGEDGLALVQDVRHGRYGYIRQDGKVAIKPQYREARSFSEGLAPVRVGDRWGYVTTSGATAIPPRFTEAFPFNGGRALVLDGTSSFFFVDSNAERVHDTPFLGAESFSEGVAIVGDGKRSWYVDEATSRLPIGEAVPPAVGDSGGCSSGVSQGVSTYYVSGLTFFQVVNQTTMKWTTTGTDTSGGGSGMTVNPGLPALVDSGLGPKSGQYTFLHHYNSFAGNPKGTYPLFDLTMASGGYTITLSNSVNYTQPPPPATHPWWEYLADAVDAMDGLFSAVTGEWAEVALGIYDMVNSAYDIAAGTVDDQPNNNNNVATDNVLVTTLTVKNAAGQLAPLDGGYCGGDSFTVSDGSQYVFSLTTVKSKYMPPTIQLSVTPWSTYFAQNAQGKLDMYRRGNAQGTPVVATPPASCIYAVAFENFSDGLNSAPCHFPTAFPTYDYFTKASSLDANTALEWWNFANNLNELGSDLPTVTKWLRTFGGACGTLPATCPSVAPMTVSPPSCSQSTLDDNCNCVFTLVNASGPVYQAQTPQLMSTTTCVGDPPPNPCTVTLQVPKGSGPTTVTLTDGATNVVVPVTCTARALSVQPLSYTGSSYPGPCPFTVQASGPLGPVSATPSTFVTSNACTAATAGTCAISLSVPSGTPASTISLSDGQTTLPISVSCSDIPMSIPDNGRQIIQQTYNDAPCSTSEPVHYPHGPVVVTPASAVTSSDCTAAGAGCTVALGIGASTSQWVSFSDGVSTQGFTFSCYARAAVTGPPSEGRAR